MAKQDTIPGKTKLERLFDQGRKSNKFLVLHNDDVHSFNYVIKSLMEVCKHDEVRATQCTTIAHYKGKCEIRKGSVNQLKPFKQELIKRGLKVTID